MALSRNDGKNTRTRAIGYPFAISRDGLRVVTDRATGTRLGDITPYGDRWDVNAEFSFIGSARGYETITDAASTLHRKWTQTLVPSGTE